MVIEDADNGPDTYQLSADSDEIQKEKSAHHVHVSLKESSEPETIKFDRPCFAI